MSKGNGVPAHGFEAVGFVGIVRALNLAMDKIAALTDNDDDEDGEQDFEPAVVAIASASVDASGLCHFGK